jgi:DNA replication protein DnaC
LAARSDRQLQRRVKAAPFRALKPLDQFDWAFNPSIKTKQVLDLATCRFVREQRDVLWLGPPGVGTSFLVPAVGYQAIKAGHRVLYRSVFDVVRDFLHDEARSAEDKVRSRSVKPDLLIIDDMGMKPVVRPGIQTSA